jgi:chorismate synthase
MPTNCLGDCFTVNLFGESHGECVGALVSGCPSGLPLEIEEIQKELDRRKPGQSKVTTARKEEDIVHVRTGMFEGKTTGMPIVLIIENGDVDSSKYEEMRTKLRPGHADLAYHAKYHHRDHRGGGFSSGRLTAGIVAAGAIAKKVIGYFSGINIAGYTKAIGNLEAQNIDLDEVEKNIVRCPDPKVAEEMVKLIEKVRAEGDSIGGLVEVIARGVPLGLGGPRFDNLKGALDRAFHSSGAVTAIEYGRGIGARYMRGSEFNDLPYSLTRKLPSFATNNSGGIQGGISNRNEIVARLTIRPTPSIGKPQKTLDVNYEAVSLVISGRHDPCLCPRMVPVSEALMAITLADVLLKQRAYEKF